jgi:tRNA threonylcarbamoyladenosine biosynthesis protein TsaB
LTVLGIDTSGKIASVCLGDEEKIIAQTTILTKLTHSQVILPLVKKVLSDADIKLSDVDVIAVADGPGSYTGLRIGIAAVKAMCFALSKKCIGISTLESLSYNCVLAKGIIIPLMKARADIAYFAAFESDGVKIRRLCEDGVLPVSEIVNIINSYDDVILTGDYAAECYENYFSDNENARLAGAAQRLQLASSLCTAAIVRKNELSEPDFLEARYLQITKAEKDLQK